MTQEELNEIESKIEIKIREIAENTRRGYLNCHIGQWKDGGEYVHRISKMDTTYLKRCLSTVKRSKYSMYGSFKYVNEVIQINEDNLTLDDKDKILNITKKYLYDLGDEKIEEIESELSKR